MVVSPGSNTVRRLKVLLSNKFLRTLSITCRNFIFLKKFNVKQQKAIDKNVIARIGYSLGKQLTFIEFQNCF